jgi:hypothetical protein
MRSDYVEGAEWFTAIHHKYSVHPMALNLMGRSLSCDAPVTTVNPSPVIGSRKHRWVNRATFIPSPDQEAS